ncbi:MAG: hypothetical protein U5K71_10710 [Gracilimonas sp.]|nr:hypothetical protein [Gracilimonas sp.]
MNLLDTATASDIAIQKSKTSAEAVALEPGKYTVILEPDASVGLLGNMFSEWMPGKLMRDVASFPSRAEAHG